MRDRAGNREFPSNVTKPKYVVSIISGREKLFANTTAVLGVRTEWDKLTVAVAGFTGTGTDR